MYTPYFAFLLSGILVIFDQITPLHNHAFLAVAFGLFILGLVILENADGLIVLLAMLFLMCYKNVFISDFKLEDFLSDYRREQGSDRSCGN